MHGYHRQRRRRAGLSAAAVGGLSAAALPGYRHRRCRAIGSGGAGLSAAAVPGYRQRRMHLGPVYKGVQAHQKGVL